MVFYDYLVHPPAQFIENTNVALKIQSFLSILIQEKGGHKENVMVNSTNGEYIGQGCWWWRQVEFMNIVQVLGGMIVDFTDICNQHLR